MRIKGGDDNVGIERVASSGSGDGPGLRDGRGEGFRAVPGFRLDNQTRKRSKSDEQNHEASYRFTPGRHSLGPPSKKTIFSSASGWPFWARMPEYLSSAPPGDSCSVCRPGGL